MKYTLKAYAMTPNGHYTIKFFENADPVTMETLYNRYFHVTLEDKYHAYDFDAHFNNYAPAEALFKATVREYGITKVFISTEYLEWLKSSEEWEEAPMTQEEEYAEACMAEAHGEPSLMRRYEEKYEIEKDYSPSNPWNAPGMSVHDFI